MIDPLVGLSRLYGSFGDLSGHDLDGPLPEDAVGQQEHLRSLSAQLVERARREKPTIRELYSRSGHHRGFRRRSGTATDIADFMQEWF